MHMRDVEPPCRNTLQARDALQLASRGSRPVQTVIATFENIDKAQTALSIKDGASIEPFSQANFEMSMKQEHGGYNLNAKTKHVVFRSILFPFFVNFC